MYKFIKNNIYSILGVLLSVFSLIYIYLYESIVRGLCGRSPNLLLFMAGGFLIIGGLLFFACHCGPLIVITCKENLCTVKQIAKVINYNDKGVKLLIDDSVFILPCKLNKKKYPIDSDIEVYTDKDMTTVYYPIKGESTRHIVGMLLSILFVFASTIGLAYLIHYLNFLG